MSVTEWFRDRVDVGLLGREELADAAAAEAVGSGTSKSPFGLTFAKQPGGGPRLATKQKARFDSFVPKGLGFLVATGLAPPNGSARVLTGRAPPKGSVRVLTGFASPKGLDFFAKAGLVTAAAAAGLVVLGIAPPKGSGLARAPPKGSAFLI